MSTFSYYSIANGGITGSLAILDILPNVLTLNPTELLAEGYVRFIVPDDSTTIFTRYQNGQVIMRSDPPPYWDELGKGLITNSLFQRLQSLRYSSPAINVSMAQISEVIGIGKNQISLAYTVVGLRSILVSINSPITPQEITETEALLVGCGFEPNFFTYAQNVVNPPTPPLI